MASKKKLAVSAVAIAAAASMLLGGTFAWQSISQTALNEKEAVINPGGRLHDDFDGENKDVYVENFADEDIYARVRLDEYLEIIMNKGTAVQETEVVTTDADKDDTNTYLTHKFGDVENTTDDYFTWNFGGETVYLPTFNKNKDSLQADINGTMKYTNEEGNADPYGDYVEYTDGQTVTDDAVYDADSNTVDEFTDDSAQENINYILVNEEHIAKKTGKANLTEDLQLISMEDWLALESDTDNYWVYDTDGWVYWSSPIKAGTATGLLLDSIKLNQVMDDSYYYAINVVGQFITADDLGMNDNTGFYADADNIPSDNALALLKKIGVNTEATTLAAGLYDAEGNLLCKWEDCGIELNPVKNEDTESDYTDEEDTTTARYILENTYPGTVKIVLPDDATSIGEYVFKNCFDLQVIDIKNVETLGKYAFYNCQSLTTVTGDYIKTLGEMCFSSCGFLATVNTGKVETIPNAAFQDTGSLKTLDLSGVKTVEAYSAFYNCGVEEIDLSNAEVIGSSAFQCAAAKKIILDQVTELKDQLFCWMSNLEAIKYQGVEYTDVDTLKTALETNGVKLADTTFYECNFNTSVETE